MPNMGMAGSTPGTASRALVHGIGTGALREAVQRFLKGHPHVARYAQAAQDQGGAGATVVELKQ